MYDVLEIKKDLMNKLKKKRYAHSLRVADVAYELANIYGVDRNKAYLAGLVHDIAKDFSDEDNLYYIDKYKLSSNDKVLHSLIGAIYLKERYNMDDDICNAVRFHTTGDINMSMLDKIVFVSDKIEDGRDYDGVLEIRELAFKDIDKAIVRCLYNIVRKLELSGEVVSGNWLEMIDFYQKC